MTPRAALALLGEATPREVLHAWRSKAPRLTAAEIDRLLWAIENV